jgi:ABC-2 type transport system ATP-binding protein
MIEVNDLKKVFKNGRGVNEISFQISEGTAFGFIGPNGAGKSTTIRNLMGFLKPQSGSAKIKGYDCWNDSEKIKSFVGYLPGEIAFPSGVSAMEFLKYQAGINNMKDLSKMKDLIDRFKLNVNIPINKMSKGMKQKLAIIATFMKSPEVILLDEPSTGLDPLMQEELISLFKEEKERGATLFLSSHIFEEIENVADEICIIKDGKIVKYATMDDVQKEMSQSIYVTFKTKNDIEKLKLDYKLADDLTAQIQINNNVNEVIRIIANFDVEKIDIKEVKLKEIFNEYYK